MKIICFCFCFLIGDIINNLQEKINKYKFTFKCWNKQWMLLNLEFFILFLAFYKSQFEIEMKNFNGNKFKTYQIMDIAILQSCILLSFLSMNFLFPFCSKIKYCHGNIGVLGSFRLVKLYFNHFTYYWYKFF